MIVESPDQIPWLPIWRSQADPQPRFHMYLENDVANLSPYITISDNHCCGVKELSGVRDSYNDGNLDRDLLTISRVLVKCAGAAFFTGAAALKEERDYALTLKVLIEERGLGTVTASPIFNNPNTSNYITLYTWTFNRQAMSKWVEAEDKKLKEKWQRSKQSSLTIDQALKSATIT